ncbi:hypothetical protein CVT25_012641 [Psilocybe cyanescens]|uniref:Uncharacterized protein n=1 Tax=Psilocybe cyanescens TaxID=93625 RepID=A0A409XUQ5_PSICY|nr:hypothetical protein CVT25_012641 [Psilocybe cyanescens]
MSLTELHPINVVNKAYSLVSDTLLDNTKSTYVAGICCFNKFCDEKGLDKEACMPASVIMLMALLTGLPVTSQATLSDLGS